VTDAIICGHDGNIWATSPKLQATPQELKKVIDNIGNSDALGASGVHIGGIK
jgi:profilin